MGISFFFGVAQAALPAPFDLQAQWGVDGTGRRNQNMRFNYDPSYIQQVSALRLYQKKPGDAGFFVAATFNNPYSIYSECPYQTESAGKSLYAGDWTLTHFCAPAFWEFNSDILGSVSTFPVGQYDFYIAVLDSSGQEVVFSEVASQYVLEQSRILSPSPGDSPSNVTVLRWSVPSGWPSNFAHYVIEIFEGAPAGQGPIFVQGVEVGDANTIGEFSISYTGPKLDPAKTYTVLIQEGSAVFQKEPSSPKNPAGSPYRSYISLSTPVKIGALLWISNIRVNQITDTSAQILWDTDTPVVSSVEYKVGTIMQSNGFATAVTSNPITSHNTRLTYLSPDTTYYYYIRLWDTARNESRSEVFSFKTLAVPPLLKSASETPMLLPVNVTKPATEIIIAEIQDGARVTIPPQAALSSGTVTVEIAPTIKAPPDMYSVVVSTIYDINLKDQAGQPIRDLRQEIEVSLPYSDEKLKSQDLKEDEIFPSYYDDSQKKWVKIEKYIQDKLKNIITAKISHLTRFAIIAAADITPPDAPANIEVAATGDGRVEFKWKNPSRDFYGVKIYRSQVDGKIGMVIARDIFIEKFTDNEVRDGVIYYYTVRSVDPAGNESTNIKQSSISVKGTPARISQEVGIAILRENLRVGSSGNEVRTLQEVLSFDELYPAGLINGNFDEYTKQAVILFQEKYAVDILIPAGLSRGTGTVGPSTWKKVVELHKVKEAQDAEKKLKEEVESGKEIKPEITAPTAPPLRPPGIFYRMWRAILSIFGR